MLLTEEEFQFKQKEKDYLNHPDGEKEFNILVELNGMLAASYYSDNIEYYPPIEAFGRGFANCLDLTYANKIIDTDYYYRSKESFVNETKKTFSNENKTLGDNNYLKTIIEQTPLKAFAVGFSKCLEIMIISDEISITYLTVIKEILEKELIEAKLEKAKKNVN